MKWVIRVAAGVVIAVLLMTAIKHGGTYRGLFGAVFVILYCVGRYEGIDMSNWDDDDDQGPLRPA